MSLPFEQQPKERSWQTAKCLPFEQQPNESSKAFAAFSLYLSLGPQRSVREVARKLGKSLTVIGRWSSKFDWPARVRARAAHLATVERQAIEGLAVEKAVEWHNLHEAVRREAWKRGTELLAMADEFLERWRNCSRVPGFESVVRGIELAMKLKQLAAGMPTEVREVKGEIRGTLEIEWELALKKVYGQAEPARQVAAPGAIEVVEVVVGPQRTEDKSQSLLTSAPTGGGALEKLKTEMLKAESGERKGGGA